jgi:hypothetical protein
MEHLILPAVLTIFALYAWIVVRCLHRPEW